MRAPQAFPPGPLCSPAVVLVSAGQAGRNLHTGHPFPPRFLNELRPPFSLDLDPSLTLIPRLPRYHLGECSLSSLGPQGNTP